MEIIIKKIFANKRLDKVLSSLIDNVSRSYIKFLIENKKVKVNGKIEKPSYRVSENDVVEWHDFEHQDFIKTTKKLNIIFKNKNYIVINKPAGINVHPSDSLKPRTETTILDMLINEYPEIISIEGKRPGIVHRLDRDTSGVLIIALNQESLNFIKKQFKNREVKKEYLTLVYGNLEHKEGVIDAPIGRNPKDRSKMAVVAAKEGRDAITEYKVIDHLLFKGLPYSFLSVHPITGRTHQIRVHFSSIGHPIVGDKIYGPKDQKIEIKRQFLHAKKLGINVLDSKYKEFEVNLPPDLNNIIKEMSK